jgi:hypothetical protein
METRNRRSVLFAKQEKTQRPYKGVSNFQCSARLHQAIATHLSLTFYSIMSFKSIAPLVFLGILLVTVSGTRLHKRDSSDIISPVPGQQVTQDMSIVVRTWRWGMSYFVNANYTVHNHDNIVIYGPVMITEHGFNTQNLTVLGIGEYKIVLTQALSHLNYTTAERYIDYHTQVVPFTVVRSLPTETKTSELPTTESTDSTAPVTVTPPTTSSAPTLDSIPTTTSSAPTLDSIPTTTTTANNDDDNDDNNVSSQAHAFSPNIAVMFVLLIICIVLYY